MDTSGGRNNEYNSPQTIIHLIRNVYIYGISSKNRLSTLIHSSVVIIEFIPPLLLIVLVRRENGIAATILSSSEVGDG
jgi:flavin reductase (DIM6/NTAB) family NADH-FMN oxidoreductase RutF